MGDPEEDQVLQAEHFAIGLQPIEGGGTRVTVMSTAFRPKAFHDELLAYGGLPVTLARWGMELGEE